MEQDGSLRSNLYLHRQRSHSYTIANKILLISIMRFRESCLSCTSAIIHFVSFKVQTSFIWIRNGTSVYVNRLSIFLWKYFPVEIFPKIVFFPCVRCKKVVCTHICGACMCRNLLNIGSSKRLEWLMYL